MFKKFITVWLISIIFTTFLLQIITIRLSTDYITKSNNNITAIKNNFYSQSDSSIKTNINPLDIYEKIISVNKTSIEEDVVHFKGTIYFICILYLIIVICITMFFIRQYEKKSLCQLSNEVSELVNLKLQIDKFDFVNEKKIEKN